jgi:hypothetical protein
MLLRALCIIMATMLAPARAVHSQADTELPVGQA